MYKFRCNHTNNLDGDAAAVTQRLCHDIGAEIVFSCEPLYFFSTLLADAGTIAQGT